VTPQHLKLLCCDTAATTRQIKNVVLWTNRNSQQNEVVGLYIPVFKYFQYSQEYYLRCVGNDRPTTQQLKTVVLWTEL